MDVRITRLRGQLVLLADLYGVSVRNLIKIGSTRNLPSRLRSLQLMSPIPLLLLGVSERNIERHCHYILGPWRIHGEWFLPAPRVFDVNRDIATVKNAKLR